MRARYRPPRVVSNPTARAPRAQGRTLARVGATAREWIQPRGMFVTASAEKVKAEINN
jgi:hypothetical protein